MRVIPVQQLLSMLTFRIPHFTHHSAANFRTVHSAFYFRIPQFRILPGPVCVQSNSDRDIISVVVVHKTKSAANESR